MRNITLQFGFNKNVTWKRNLLFNHTFTIAYSCMLLQRNQNLGNIVCKQFVVLHFSFDVFFHLSFFAAYGLQHIPFILCCCHFLNN